MDSIKLLNIDFSYSKNGNTQFSISDLNFEIQSGDFISILGPNGSGKSTLIKIIANILKPSKGTRTLNNLVYEKISKRNFAKHVAYVPQSSSTNFPFSIFEIVMMGRSPYLNFMGIHKKNDEELVNKTLELFEIDHLKNKGITEVSGGEAQRALIARAIVQNPKIILLDEPNTHLDVKHQLSIFNTLAELNRKKKLTVLTISHDLNLSNRFSSRIVLMKDGEIIYNSSPDKALTEENICKIFDVKAEIISGINNNIINLY